MKSSSAILVAVAGVVYFSFAVAQPPATQPQGQRPPTIEDRVAALERGLASVTTRFNLREAAVPPAAAPPGGGALEARVGMLERTLDRLTQEIQNVQRSADSAQRAADAAARDAADARRTAQDADRNAQNALLRAH
jgi:ABC-type transporter Mla subunit MlaD